MLMQPGSPTAPAARGNGRGAFTLTELLIVMGVIVLALTLAIPAIRALTGSRSTEAAQNTLSAFLARARTEAIGLQQVRGVLFYLDPTTKRVTGAQVAESGYQPLTDRVEPVYLDLAPDHDVMTLPVGVLPMTMKDNATVNGTGNIGMYAGQRYLEFNTDYATNVGGAALNPAQGLTPLGGVILFDAEGRVSSRIYGFHFTDVSATGALSVSALGQLAGLAAPTRSNWPNNRIPQLNQFLHAQIAFVLVDDEALRANSGGATAEANNTSAAAQQQKEQWIDANTTPIFINRYNGTLTRAE